MITRIAHITHATSAMYAASKPTTFGNELDPFDPWLNPGIPGIDTDPTLFG